MMQVENPSNYEYVYRNYSSAKFEARKGNSYLNTEK
jgi:hypothetical protein